MAQPPVHRLLSHIRGLIPKPHDVPAADGTLLRQFVEQHDEAAFAEIMDWHGGLVWGVCYRVLGHAADAEDAFQATFMVLARKAAAIVKKESLPSWLHGVAYRVACKLRRMDMARRQREDQAPLREGSNDLEELTWREVRQVLDEELARLPEKYRLPLLLCYLEGKTQDEAARQLGWGVGVFRGWLDRGRDRLRERLLRRGIGLPAALAGVLAAQSVAEAAVPPALRSAALKAALAFASRAAAPAELVVSNAWKLAEGTLHTMMLAKGKALALVVLVLLVLAGGAGLAAKQAVAVTEPEAPQAAGREAPPPGPKADKPKEQPDLDGEPLPPGAVARIGTPRFRHHVWNVAFAPDGKTLVSGGFSGGMRLWDMATGKEIRRFGNARGRVGPAVFSPDGKIVAAAAPDGEAGVDWPHTIWLWEAATGKEVCQLKGQPNEIFSVRFSPDGKTLASAGSGWIFLWNLTTRKELVRKQALPFDAKAAELKDDFADSACTQILSVAFSPDGKTLAAGKQRRGMLLLDVATGREIRRLDEENVDDRFDEVAFSPDGKTLAAASERDVGLWDPATGKKFGELTGQKHIASVVFSPDGKMLATGSPHGTIFLWDVATAKQVRRLDGAEGWTGSVAFSPDGKVLAAGHKAIQFWDVATGKEIRQDDGPVGGFAMTFAPDGKTLVTAEGRADPIQLWSTATGKVVRRFGGDASVNGPLAISPDGKWLASGSGDASRLIYLWDMAAGKEVWRLQPSLKGPLDSPMSFAFSPDGKTLASHTLYGEIALWDVVTGKQVDRVPDRPTRGGPLAFSADGKMLIADSTRGKLVLEVATGKKIDQGAKAAACSPDGKLLALGGNDGITVVQDAVTGAKIRQLEGPLIGSVVGLRFLPAGKTLLAEWFPKAGGRLHYSLWEVDTGKEIRQIDHQSGIGSLALAPDGMTLALAAEDTIQLQDLPTGQKIGEFKLAPEDAGYLTVEFAPDGKTLISRNMSDASTFIWDVQRLGRARPKSAPTDKDPQQFWPVLAGNDAGKAYGALGELAAAPQGAVSFLQKQLRPVPAPDAQQLVRLIADLDSGDFAVRQKATEEIQHHGEAAIPGLRKVLAGKPSLELRQRVEQLLQQASGLTPEQLRQQRVILALEWMATAEAKQLLQTLAQGPEWPQRTRADAQAALMRLAKRAEVP